VVGAVVVAVFTDASFCIQKVKHSKYHRHNVLE
jgi:hypothetical protein